MNAKKKGKTYGKNDAIISKAEPIIATTNVKNEMSVPTATKGGLRRLLRLRLHAAYRLTERMKVRGVKLVARRNAPPTLPPSTIHVRFTANEK